MWPQLITKTIGEPFVNASFTNLLHFASPKLTAAKTPMENEFAHVCRWVSIFLAKEKMLEWLKMPLNSSFEKMLEKTNFLYPKESAK